MLRVSRSANLDEIIRAAIAPVLERASAAIAKALSEVADARIGRGPGRANKLRPRPRGKPAGASRPRRNVDMTQWAADRRARRVPTFVIEATGLDTKKKIVAQFGEGATFVRGKPLPAPRKDPNPAGLLSRDVNAPRVVKAKGPRIRKASGA
jgi:hypothetical protein